MTSTARRGAPAGSALDADGLDALIEERDHLLRSLDDLEREFEAGDVDKVDYVTLRDDYTARAAAVIRSIEAKRARIAPTKSGRSWKRTVAWVVVVALFAVVAGVLVARMSGVRRDGETISGSTRDSTRQLIADATNAVQQRDYDDAIGLYTRVLDLAPADVEAFTYRGWAKSLSGDTEGGLADLDQAKSINPDYPDARVFGAIALAELGRWTDAAVELRAFDALEPSSFMQQIVAQNFLRERIVAGVLNADGAPGFAEAGFTADDVVAAADYTAEQAAPAEGLRLVDQVLDAEPDHVDARALRGWILARVGVNANDAAVTARGLADLDAALAVDPQHPAALVYRSFTLLYGYDDAAGAKAALDSFDALDDKPQDLVALVEGQGLRSEISRRGGG